MKNKTTRLLHRVIGLSLCGIAGASIGFVFGGFSLAILGILPGHFIGHFLEQLVTKIP